MICLIQIFSFIKNCLYLEIGPSPVSLRIIRFSPLLLKLNLSLLLSFTIIAAIRLAAQAQQFSTANSSLNSPGSL